MSVGRAYRAQVCLAGGKLLPQSPPLCVIEQLGGMLSHCDRFLTLPAYHVRDLVYRKKLSTSI